MQGERWFYRSDDEWNAFAERLKLTVCPHFCTVGTLIRHGTLGGSCKDRPDFPSR